jgi:hypothetical protein
MNPGCLHCGEPIEDGGTGRPRRFCSDECRDQARRRRNLARTGRARRGRKASHETPPQWGTADPAKVEKNLAQNQELAVPQKSISGNRPLRWDRINAVTWKLTDGEIARVSAEAAGTRTGFNVSRAVAWVIDVGWVAGRVVWFARVHDERGDWSFGSTTIERAKAAAERRVNHAPFDPRPDERAFLGPVDLNRVAAGLLDQSTAIPALLTMPIERTKMAAAATIGGRP